LSVIEKIEIERAGQTFDLNLRGLDLGFAKKTENAWTDKTHDQRNNGDNYEDLDQRKSAFGVTRRMLSAIPS